MLNLQCVMNVCITTNFDPIGALLFGVISGLVAGTVIVLWVSYLCIKAEIKNRREKKGRK